MGKICTFCKHKRAENRCALIFSNASVEYTERCCYYEPVEEVLPVIHAHWALYLDENNCTYGNYACTNCHTIQGLMKYRYCPYCGAKMDEVVEE